MKKLITIILLCQFTNLAYAQNETLPNPEPYFSAMIVSNMDNSIAWYTKNLGLEVLDKNENKEMGYKQANLKRGNLSIELIELKTAVSPESVIPNYNSKTRLIGIFKTGILVSDFDNWIDFLMNQEVEFHGNVVIDPISSKKMVIIKDPDGNRIQIFEK